MQHSSRSRLLIFEPDHLGHSLEWLRHIAVHARSVPASPDLIFAVAPELACQLGALITSNKGPRISILSLSERDCRLATGSNLIVSAIARWRTMKRCLNATNAEHGVFMEFDHLSLAFALGLSTPRPVSGVLFRPSVHYRRLFGTQPNKAERIRDLRKSILYRLMLRNRSLGSVLSLDPFFPAHAASTYRDGNKVAAVPDPMFPLTPADPSASKPLRRPWPIGRTRFLFFGVISERKGIDHLIESLAGLEAEVAARTAVLIVGAAPGVFGREIAHRIASLRERRPDLWIEFDRRRPDFDELGVLVATSDVVLAPYQRFVGSSGLLLWAAGAGKPVLTQDYGLIGRLVRDYRLGLAVDTTDPATIGRTMTRIVLDGPARHIDPGAASAFAADHDAAVFAKAILDCGAETAAVATPATQPQVREPNNITEKAGPYHSPNIDVVT